MAATPPPPPPPPQPPSPSAPAPSDPHAGGDLTGSPLRRRRDELAEQVAEQQWDLGGLAFEMAIRDHFRLDVLVRRAALLQACDAELAEVERLLRLEDGASVGGCPSCAAPHSRGALFCWQCGATLMERAPSAAVSAAHAAVPAAQDPVEQEAQRTRIAKRDGAGPARDELDERDTLIMNPVATADDQR